MKKLLLIPIILLLLCSCEEKKAVDVEETSESKNADQLSQQNIKIQTPFTFRGMIMGASLKDQLPECQDDWYKKTNICYKNIAGEINHYDIQLLPDIGFGTVTDVNIIDGNIEKISTYTGDRNAIVMLDLLQKKYGKPLIYNTKIIQNKLGAKFLSVYAQWKIKNCDITFMNRVVNIDDGYLIIETQKWQNQEKEKGMKKEKEALDKL